MNTRKEPVLVIGDNTFYPETNSLEGPEGSIRLPPKAVEVLKLFCRYPATVLRRDDILQEVWPNQSLSEDVLNQAVLEIRKALGDSSKQSQYIETIPRVGYRLVASVQEQGAQPDRKQRRLLFAIVPLLLIVTAVVYVQLIEPESTHDKGPDRYVELDLGETTTLLLEGSGNGIGQLSPDQRLFAFSQNINDNRELTLLDLASGNISRLTHTPKLDEGHPVFSSDGRFIVYRMLADEQCMIQRYNRSTGQSGTVYNGCYASTRLDLSPDDAWIAFTKRVESGPENLRGLSLFLIRPDGTDLRRFSYPGTQSLADIHPKFSPDSRSVAFIRGEGRQVRRLMLQGLDDDNARYLRTDNWVTGLDWHPNGRMIVLSAHHHEMDMLEVLDLASMTVYPAGLSGVISLDVARQGESLVYAQAEGASTIVSQDLINGEVRDLINREGPGYLFNTAISHDGKHLAYVSTEDDNSELYLRDLATGKDTRLSYRLGGGPALVNWLPESGNLLFLVQNDKGSRIYHADTSSGAVLPVAPLAHLNVNDLAVSTDGQWIYFIANHTGQWNLWRISHDMGPLQQLSLADYNAVLASPDPDVVYVYEHRADRIDRLDASSGMIETVAEGVKLYYPSQWVMGEGELLYLDVDAVDDGAIPVVALALDGSEPRQVGHVQAGQGYFPSITLDTETATLYFDRLKSFRKQLILRELTVTEHNVNSTAQR